MSTFAELFKRQDLTPLVSGIMHVGLPQKAFSYDMVRFGQSRRKQIGTFLAMIKRITIRTPGQGLFEITENVNTFVRDSEIEDGLCTVFVQHTSASLVIQENADPTAKADLERWLNKLVRERDPDYTHTAEGPDDMPSHIKCSLTATSLGIPVGSGELLLGTWQGIYLWEHRRHPHNRNIVIHLCGV